MPEAVERHPLINHTAAAAKVAAEPLAPLRAQSPVRARTEQVKQPGMARSPGVLNEGDKAPRLQLRMHRYQALTGGVLQLGTVLAVHLHKADKPRHLVGTLRVGE